MRGDGSNCRLVYGVDWKGRTCGAVVKGNDGYDLTAYKYMIYPRFVEALARAQLEKKPISLHSMYGVCVKSCPDPSKGTIFVHAYHDYAKNSEPVNNNSNPLTAQDEDISAGSPWQIIMNTTNSTLHTLFYFNICDRGCF